MKMNRKGIINVMAGIAMGMLVLAFVSGAAAEIVNGNFQEENVGWDKIMVPNDVWASSYLKVETHVPDPANRSNYYAKIENMEYIGTERSGSIQQMINIPINADNLSFKRKFSARAWWPGLKITLGGVLQKEIVPNRFTRETYSGWMEEKFNIPDDFKGRTVLLIFSTDDMNGYYSGYPDHVGEVDIDDVYIEEATSSEPVIKKREIYDDINPLPVGVFEIVPAGDIVINNYFHPGTGGSCEQAQKLFVWLAVEKGIKTICINPREVNASMESDFSDLTLERHVEDMQKVVSQYQSQSPNLPYKVGGHSAGAIVAAIVASRDSNPMNQGLYVLDMVGQYSNGSQEQKNARYTSKAYKELLKRGVYMDTSLVEAKQLAEAAKNYPDGVSEVPRAKINTSWRGNFTYEELFGMMLIKTSSFPGITTSLTGLSDNWNIPAYIAGNYYVFPSTPPNWYYALTFQFTKNETIFEAINDMGSGIIPIVYLKDISEVEAGMYKVDWQNIRVPVDWRNTGKGIGCDNGPQNVVIGGTVNYSCESDYGHADLLWADGAFEEFWKPLLFPN